MSTSTLCRRCIPALAIVVGLGGCAGATATGPFVPGAAAQSGPQALPLHGGFRMFAANRDGASVVAFESTANGNVAPVVTIAGSKTTLSQPDALTMDVSGKIYVANDGGTQVAVFGPHANGNVKPARIIGGSNSNLDVTEYAAGASGNVSPIDTIAGGNTQLTEPLGMAMNAKGELFVANGDASTIVVFAKGASGNATP